MQGRHYKQTQRGQFNVTLDQHILNDSLLILKQEGLISQLLSKCTSRTLESELSQISFQSHDCTPKLKHGLSNFETTRRNSFFSNDEDSNAYLKESLEEIRYRCSRKTFNLIQRALYSNQNEFQTRNEKRLEREMRHNQELINKIQKLEKEKISLLNKIKEVEKQRTLANKNENISSKLRRNRSVMHSLENQEKYVKMRQLEILKEKAGANLTKFLERHIAVLQQNRKQIIHVKQQILRIIDQGPINNVMGQQLKSVIRNAIVSNNRASKKEEQLLISFQHQINSIATNLQNKCSA